MKDDCTPWWGCLIDHQSPGATRSKSSGELTARTCSYGIFEFKIHSPDWMLCVSVRSEVAILYNDRSVLENHHVSAAYRLMAEEDMNILVNLNKDDWRFAQTRSADTSTSWTSWTPLTVVTDQWLIVCVDYWQGAEVSGDRDGDVHRHVLSLPANQDHEERPDTDTRVSAAVWPLNTGLHLKYSFG